MKQVILNPYKFVDFETVNKYKANYHTHTTRSDGTETPAEKIEAYANYDYDILALTEHDTMAPNIGGQASTGITTWPWSDFLEDGESNPILPTAYKGYGCEVYEVNSKTIMGVEGNELSSNDHRVSLFNNLWTLEDDTEYQTIRNDIDWTLEEVENRLGFSFIAHPGRYSRDVDFYVDLYKKLSKCFGLEVYNQGDKYIFDRELWDNILRVTMPHRPIWGLSNTDDHIVAEHIGRNYNIMLMSELSPQALRRSMLRGEFYFVYDPDGTDIARHDPVVTPIINNIEVDERRISISSINTSQINWISDGKQVATGDSLDLARTRNLGKYVRARLIGSNGGFAYTQPFGLSEVGQVGKSGGLFPPLRGG